MSTIDLLPQPKGDDRMIVEETRDGVAIRGVSAINVANTLICGQAFRWWPIGDAFHGVVGDRLLAVNQDEDSIVVVDHSYEPCDTRRLAEIVSEYFCLESDHEAIEGALRRIDGQMNEAVEYAPGIRILRQDPWECLMSYLVSARNYIPNIMKTISTLSRLYGRRVSSDEYEVRYGTRHYTFPSADRLANVAIEEIEATGAAFRAKYMSALARAVASGQVDLSSIARLPYEEARTALMANAGVGPKISECVLLFSMGKYEAFPIDVWISRVMRFLYLDDPAASVEQIHGFARRHFGCLAGFAQEYLFHWGRTCKGAYLRSLDKGVR